MIFLEPTNYNGVCSSHYSKLESRLRKKINSNNPLLPWSIKQFLLDNLKEIITGLPDKLKTINDGFYASLGAKRKKSKHIKAINGKFAKIIDYELFSEKRVRNYDAYDLAEELDIQTCTYCNRQRTITVLKSKSVKDHITRPQFDHFFPQSKYPLLALSFYNLIPSCSLCNTTLKGEKELKLDDHIHPYIDNCYNYFSFSFVPKNTISIKGTRNNHKITLNTDDANNPNLAKKIKNTFDIFKVTEIYNGHSEEISDLLRLKDVMSDKYLEMLANNTYKNLSISEDELYRLAFGTYRDEANFSKRPFSKLKKDILKELGMIK